MLEEKWEFIKGFNTYQISTLGRIRTYNKIWYCGNGAKRVSHLKPVPFTYGKTRGHHYYRCTLTEDGRQLCTTVHRLVATQFIPNPEDKPEVDHIDRNIYNNSVTNLRWVTAKENCENRRR